MSSFTTKPAPSPPCNDNHPTPPTESGEFLNNSLNQLNSNQESTNQESTDPITLEKRIDRVLYKAGAFDEFGMKIPACTQRTMGVYDVEGIHRRFLEEEGDEVFRERLYQSYIKSLNTEIDKDDNDYISNEDNNYISESLTSLILGLYPSYSFDFCDLLIWPPSSLNYSENDEFLNFVTYALSLHNGQQQWVLNERTKTRLIGFAEYVDALNCVFLEETDDMAQGKVYKYCLRVSRSIKAKQKYVGYCVQLLHMLYRRSLLIASEPHGDGSNNPTNGGYMQACLIIQILSRLENGRDRDEKEEQAPWLEQVKWPFNPFATICLLTSTTRGEVYPHCNEDCYEDFEDDGAEEIHDCCQVNDFFKFVASRVTWNLDEDRGKALETWTRERFKDYNEGNRIMSEMLREDIEKGKKKKDKDVVNRLMKRDVWFKKGLEGKTGMDDIVEFGLVRQIVRCLGVWSIYSVVIDFASIRLHNRNFTWWEASSFRVAETVRYQDSGSVFLELQKLLRAVSKDGSSNNVDVEYTDLSPATISKELEKAIKLSPAIPPRPITQKHTALPAGLFPRLHKSKSYKACIEALVTLGEVISVCTPDGEETDRLGAFLVNAFANALFWLPNGLGTERKQGVKWGEDRAQAHPWELWGDEKERRKRLIYLKDSIGEDTVDRMFEVVRMMYSRDMVGIDMSMGYVSWLGLTNQQIRPDDEQIYCHGINYSDKTVVNNNRFPFAERRIWNHDEFTIPGTTTADQCQWDQPPQGWRGRQRGVREWKNKFLGPTYDYNILTLKKAWSMAWDPRRHLEYGDKFREAVKTLLISSARVKMPNDIVINIIRFFGREWWGTTEDDKGGASRVLCWDRQCNNERISASIFWGMSSATAGGYCTPVRRRVEIPTLKPCKCGVAKYCSKRCKKGHAYEIHSRVCGISPYSLGISKEEDELISKVEGLEIVQQGVTRSKNEDDEEWEDMSENEEDQEWEDVSDGELSDGGTTFQGVEGKLILTEVEKGEMVERYFNAKYKISRLPHLYDSSESSDSEDDDDDDDNVEGDY